MLKKKAKTNSKLKARSRAYYKAHKEVIKKRATKYRKTHRKEYLKAQRKYIKTHKEKIKKREAKYRDTHREEFNKRHLTRKRAKKGITPKSKCVNGCKVPWFILQRHHLTYGKNEKTVIMCPNCHMLYKVKRIGKNKIRKRS